jgi:hypothetical protein
VSLTDDGVGNSTEIPENEAESPQSTEMSMKEKRREWLELALICEITADGGKVWTTIATRGQSTGEPTMVFSILNALSSRRHQLNVSPDYFKESGVDSKKRSALSEVVGIRVLHGFGLTIPNSVVVRNGRNVQKT